MPPSLSVWVETPVGREVVVGGVPGKSGAASRCYCACICDHGAGLYSACVCQKTEAEEVEPTTYRLDWSRGYHLRLEVEGAWGGRGHRCPIANILIGCHRGRGGKEIVSRNIVCRRLCERGRGGIFDHKNRGRGGGGIWTRAQDRRIHMLSRLSLTLPNLTMRCNHGRSLAHAS